MINDLSKAFDQNGLIPELMKEKEQLRKENMDLNRQVCTQYCVCVIHAFLPVHIYYVFFAG